MTTMRRSFAIAVTAGAIGLAGVLSGPAPVRAADPAFGAARVNDAVRKDVSDGLGNDRGFVFT